MCTLILHHRSDESTDFLVGANRNEVYDRPSEPPSIVEDRPGPMFAPRDARAGGTWIGINAAGVFAGLTNRFGHPAEPDRRSRGELVPHALEEESAGEAVEALGGLDASDYNPFHLLVADGDEVRLVISDGDLLTVSSPTSGLCVITERSFGAADARRKVRVRRMCKERLEAEGLDEEALREILTTCETGSMDAVCVDIPEMNYGTKSSTLLRHGSGGTRYLHAEGSPCEVDYEEVSGELEAMMSAA